MTSVVTGAFGYIGRYIANDLVAQGEPVITITTHPAKRNPFGASVRAFPYDFDRPDELVDHLRGASTLYNTYWVRFEYGGATFQHAVANTRVLFECAKRAGVERIVHISVTHAADSKLPYYVGKAQQESEVVRCGVPFSIVRPTLLFGLGDILVNNIAWLMRKFPVFPIFGSGEYHVQPIYADDLGAIAVNSAKVSGCTTVDAIGPEDWTFRDLIHLIATEIKPGEKFVNLPPSVGIALGRLIGLTVHDVILTRDELQGLMDNLLTSTQAPNGSTRFSEWLKTNRAELGVAYASELARHFGRG
jgi:NADH dehydrogenase